VTLFRATGVLEMVLLLLVDLVSYFENILESSPPMHCLAIELEPTTDVWVNTISNKLSLQQLMFG
jgi:hypothetical protein